MAMSELSKDVALASAMGVYEALATDDHLGDVGRRLKFAPRTLLGDVFEHAFEWARDKKPELESLTKPEVPLPPLVARHWPPRGRCAFCGGPDAAHRARDAIVGTWLAGDGAEALAAEHGVPIDAILSLVTWHFLSAGCGVERLR